MINNVLLAAVLGALSTTVLAKTPSSTQSLVFGTSPSSSASTVPADFVGFGYDGVFLTNYSGTFSDNLMRSVAQRMSVPPIIRVGGTSSDRLIYDKNLPQNTSCIPTPGIPCPWGGGYAAYIGPTYFDGFSSHPWARVTFQAPMQNVTNYTNAVAFATNAYQKLGSNRTAAIALGNEVDLYDDYTAAQYNAAAQKLEAEIISALKLTGDGSKIFELGDISSHGVDTGKPWTLQSALSDGLKNGNGIIAADHWYQVGSPSTTDLQSQLMNHSVITSKFENYRPTLNYAIKNKLQFALTETGSSLGAPLNFSNVFGTALYNIDFQLYAMSQGVARVASTQRPSSHHSLWVPIDGVVEGLGSSDPTPIPGPTVRAPFYAQPFLADFVGKEGEPVVQEWSMNGQSDYFTSYGAYENGSLARIAVLNLREWSGSGTRGTETFQVAVPNGKSVITGARMNASAGASAVGYDIDHSQPITYGGQQWTYAQGNGMPTPNSQTLESFTVTNGQAQIVLHDSEAILLFLGKRA